MHAVYGLGATVSPLVSTEFVKRVRNRVYLYFCVSLGLSLFTATALVLVFRGRTDDQVVGPRQPDSVASTRVEQPRDASNTTRNLEGISEEAVHKGGSGGKMRAILRTPAVHYMAFYILIYVSILSRQRLNAQQVGIEVTIGGWAVRSAKFQQIIADPG